MLTVNGAIKTSGPKTSAETGDLTQGLIRLRITDASIDDDDVLAKHTRHGIVYALRTHALKWAESADVYESDHVKAKNLPALVPDGHELDEDGYVVLDTDDLLSLMPASERGGKQLTDDDKRLIEDILAKNGLERTLEKIEVVTELVNDGHMSDEPIPTKRVESYARKADKARKTRQALNLKL